MPEIRGNIGSIKETASTIRTNASKYGSSMEVLFNTVNELKNTWTSTDGNAYIVKINSFREEFERLQKSLESSATALETTAINYERTIKANTVT